ncbi:hypothetical protein HB364_22395 [Pseudoflavitalea sp. X16]|uniref:glycoside hydrolase family 28 protein n=1 Tax=Paraflavitalea devenefica TaxID=2716334 RepID=UPI001424051F|nr:glycosyl hydrolase family 28 protein [Paraflavitalea devenefica]NII27850.1 hypothetical protein [Paraflavitalea devenefica]
MKQGAIFLLLMFCICTTYGADPVPKDYNIVDFGAVGDGKTTNTQAIQKAIDQCSSDGGGQVIVPNGVFRTGSVFLKNNVVLYLSPSAVLSGSTHKSDYAQPANALIIANEQHHIGIYGRGTIHGNGDDPAFYSKDFANGLPGRPNTIAINQCTDVKLKEFTLRNGTRWNIHLIACDYVTVDDIKVISRAVANNDGIDIDDCHHVTISNSYFDCGDDAICPKSHSARSVKNLVINNCIIKSESNGIKFGTKGVGGFRDVTISNCVIYDTRLSGIAIEMVDGGMIDRIVMNNITMQKVNGSLFIKLGKRSGDKPGVLRNVTISNLIADSIGLWKPDTTAPYYKVAANPKIGISIVGQPGYLIENITLSHVRFQFAGGGTQEDSKAVMKDEPNSYPEYTNFGVTPAYGLNLRHVNNLLLQDVQLTTLAEDARPAIFLEDARQVHMDNVKAQLSARATAFIRCKDVEDLFVYSCKPDAVPIPFLSFEGRVKEVSILNNDLHKVAATYVKEAAVNRKEIYTGNNRQ